MKLFLMLMLVIAALPFAYAMEDFSEAKQLINAGISCVNISDDQLETIGDYYMELMHPGEAHERLDQQFGGEGSASLRQVHINIALMHYCGQSMMSFGGNSGMMGNRNATGYAAAGYRGNFMMDSGMMYGNSGYWGFWMIIMAIFWLALFVVLFLLIVWLYKNTFGKSSLITLKERYAKGEMSKKEYEEMRKLLEKNGGR